MPTEIELKKNIPSDNSYSLSTEHIEPHTGKLKLIEIKTSPRILVKNTSTIGLSVLSSCAGGTNDHSRQRLFSGGFD